MVYRCRNCLLKQDAIQLFKDKAVKRGRLTNEEVSVEDTILMDNLHLVDEDGYLIRAAMLAFLKTRTLGKATLMCVSGRNVPISNL